MRAEIVQTRQRKKVIRVCRELTIFDLESGTPIKKMYDLLNKYVKENSFEYAEGLKQGINEWNKNGNKIIAKQISLTL